MPTSPIFWPRLIASPGRTAMLPRRGCVPDDHTVAAFAALGYVACRRNIMVGRIVAQAKDGAVGRRQRGNAAAHGRQITNREVGARVAVGSAQPAMKIAHPRAGIGIDILNHVTGLRCEAIQRQGEPVAGRRQPVGSGCCRSDQQNKK
jgi:hypothetical protein